MREYYSKSNINVSTLVFFLYKLQSQLHNMAFFNKMFSFSTYLRNYIGKLPMDKLLYNTTMTIPGGAEYHSYPLAFKVPLWSKTKLNS